MIKIESITIENLRGIKRFHHDFRNGSLVIHGPNGSGKSGVIDAIEFALTGNICRLSGTGTSGITLATHAPHVDFRDNSRKSKTIIQLSNELTGNSFSIERTVANSKKPEISPNNEEGEMILGFLFEHPEFSLSRREILKFIVTKPGNRATEVQKLLKIDSIDQLRGVFNKLNNETRRTFKEKENALIQATKMLLQHLEITEISKDNVLNQANERRDILNLGKIDLFSVDTKFSVGIDNDGQNKKRTVDKKLLCSRITELTNKLNATAITSTLENMSEAISNLKNNRGLLQHINKQTFYESGLNFLIDNLCPFCDTSYNSSSLKSHIQEKIAANKKATIFQQAILSGCSALKTDYNSLLNEISEIKRDAFSLELTDEAEKLVVLSERLRLDCALLDKPINNLEKISTLIHVPYSKFDAQITAALQTISGCAHKIPDFSSEAKAKRFLIIVDERIDAYKLAKQEKEAWKKKAKITKVLLDDFESISEKKLTALYKDVEKDFSTFYSKINNDDEEDFSAQLTHTKGSLNLEVDFYGRGVFPPNALHSEGHQDGMGLCLYLALTKKVLGKKFTFCLLDDVLMSVDTSHRREFCRLLKSEFPSTQFIITTHDEVWKKQLINENLVSSKQVVNFRGWSVENGPSCLNEKDTIETLDRCIKDENISEAAPILRQYLEYIMTELSCKFRVHLEFKHNNSYELGELSDAVIGRYKGFIKKAKNAANTWGQENILEKITGVDDSLSKAIKETKMEQWALNPSVHYNEWANFTPSEFSLLKEAFFGLLKQFKCSQCHGWLYTLPSKGNVEEVRCECGEFLLNFKEKEKK